MARDFYVDPDIKKARTLPSEFYMDLNHFEESKEKIFRRSWQWLPFEFPQKVGDVIPFELLSGFLNHPLFLSKDEQGKVHALSNVCTHRANLLVAEKGSCKEIRCQYHGRRFSLGGRFISMPEFEKAENFPSKEDELFQYELKSIGPFNFISDGTASSLDPFLDELGTMLGFLPLESLSSSPDQSQEFELKAHWALYCDNFLEGFHIPFVHRGLNQEIDYPSYSTRLGEGFNYQVAYSKNQETVFDFPSEHPDFGKEISAYYFWLFPNLMINAYPWGISLNHVIPISPELTKVVFHSYILNKDKMNQGAGSNLDKVEIEDEEVVESVQKGIRSPHYDRGRFSPKREQGVHQFHSLVSRFMNRAE